MADLFPPLKLRPNFHRWDTGIHPGYEQVIENISAFAYKSGTVPRHFFNEAFHEFLAELLHDLRCASGEETCGVAHGGIGAPSAIDDNP